MRTGHLCSWMHVALLVSCFAAAAAAEERHEAFDKDPGWDGRNNRATSPPARRIRQDFGYSTTAHAGGAAGEVGGLITPAAEPAYYAKKIPAQTLDDALTASGTLACTGRQFHVLIGFFNADTLGGWRTPNTLALRLYGRGESFYAYVEYATQRGRAGGDSPGGFAKVRDPKSGREQLKGFRAGGTVHRWSLRYDPKGNHGSGTLMVTLGNETAVCNLDPGHKADGGRFNRFGLVNVLKHADSGGEVWLDGLTVNGSTERFDQDPGWDQFQNRRDYLTQDVRPRFNFGYRATRLAGGKAPGELGGLVFRGDNRYADRLAYYGDRLGPLTLEKSLKATGKVSLRRGVSDSTTLLGFFHSRDSVAVSPSQALGIPECFVGVAVEGPSREGFFFYPIYRVKGSGMGVAGGSARPRISPNGSTHDWALEYVPAAAGGRGQLRVTLDRKAIRLDLGAGHQAAGARFDRFGLITTWIDGNGQQVYFDDLTYTCKQE